MDTTIKVDSTVRDRLAQIARERGTTIRDLVAALAAGTPTQPELDARAAATARYLRQHLSPELTDADVAAGEAFWRELEAGRVPSSLESPREAGARYEPGD